MLQLTQGSNPVLRISSVALISGNQIYLTNNIYIYILKKNFGVNVYNIFFSIFSFLAVESIFIKMVVFPMALFIALCIVISATVTTLESRRPLNGASVLRAMDVISCPVYLINTNTFKSSDPWI